MEKRMTLERFLEGIRFPEEGRKGIYSECFTEEEYFRWKVLFYEEEGEFFRRLEGCAGKAEKLLWLYVRFAVERYGDFREKGISEKIYFDTFYDFTIWYTVYKKRTGKPGLGEANWLALPLKGKIFRLGRLQFEPGIMREIHPGEKVLHVHIPEGEPLNREKCIASFREARAFWDGEYAYFDCESWLLAPDLATLLPPESNIRQFQSLFALQRVSYERRQAEERVFGYVSEDVDGYPENTFFQSALKAYVKKHGNVGTGYGIRNM